MVYARLSEGCTYCMLVTQIIENVKMVPTKDGTFHRHDIHFKNENGEPVKAEYLTISPVQDAFTLGKKACFECRITNQYGDTIVPVGDKAEWENQELRSFSTKPIAGQPFTFALTIAKEIAVANIRAGGYSSTGDDVKKMLNDAEEIETWLLGKQKNIL